jgi:hypothetical protein
MIRKDDDIIKIRELVNECSLNQLKVLRRLVETKIETEESLLKHPLPNND